MPSLWIFVAAPLVATGLQNLLNVIADPTRRTRPFEYVPAVAMTAIGLAVGLTQLTSLYWLALTGGLVAVNVLGGPLGRACGRTVGPPARVALVRLHKFDRWLSPASERPNLDELDPRAHPREP